jgi:hypothetical protein
MSDTDKNYAMTARDARPTALGDLRFAGTIATGLVAGTLGLGAIALPLVGWKDWQQGLTQEASSAPVQLAKLEPRANNELPSRTRAGDPSRGVGAGGGAAPIAIGLPTGGAVVGGPLVGFGDGGSTTTSTPRNTTTRVEDRAQRRNEPGTRAETTGRGGSGDFSGPKFSGDSDGDGIKDVDEEKLGSNPKVAGDTPTTLSATGTGMSVENEFKVRSMPTGWDTNGNGYPDPDEDADGDGIPNAVEQANGTDPANPDTDGDGNPDTVPVPTTPAPVETTPEPAPVEVVPPVETPAPTDGTETTDETEVPTDPTTPVEEAPATEAPAPAPAPETETPAETTQPEETPAAEQPPADEAPAAVAEAPAPAPAPEAPAPAPAPEAPAPAAAEAPAAPAPAPAPAEPAPAPAQEPAVAEAPADPAATPAF